MKSQSVLRKDIQSLLNAADSLSQLNELELNAAVSQLLKVADSAILELITPAMKSVVDRLTQIAFELVVNDNTCPKNQTIH